MAIINKPNTINRGEVANFSLDVADLLSNSSVVAHPIFNTSDNWYRVSLFYKSNIEPDMIQTTLFDPQVSTDASFFLDSNSVGDFEIQAIVLYDIMGGSLLITRENLNESDFDVILDIASNTLIDLPFLNNAVGKYGIVPTTVNASEVQPDGKILIAGGFSDYRGKIGRRGLVRLNSDGTVDESFCANASDGSKFNFPINTIAIQPDGKILVGGVFTNYGGTSDRNYLVRLNSDGTLDTAFCESSVDGNKFNNTVYSIAVRSNNSIVVGGNFTDYAGTSGRSYLVKLNSDGTLDETFMTNAVDGSKLSALVSSIIILGNGDVLVGGSFTNYNGISGVRGLISLSGTTGLANSNFLSNITNKFASGVLSLAVQSDGKILVGGDFTDFGGTFSLNRLVRLNSDGTLDSDFSNFASLNNKFKSFVRAIKVLSDSSILVGGDFITYSGLNGRDRLVRLNSDGTLDTDFMANAVHNGTSSRFKNNIYTISIQSDNKIIVGGVFINHDGVLNRAALVRLNNNGTTDSAFCENAVDGFKLNFPINTITIQSDGKVLVGGSFTDYIKTGARRLLRLNSDGTLDTDFMANAVDGSKFSSTVFAIAVQSDGKILVGGDFTNYGNVTGRNRLVRLNSDGTLDTAFMSAVVDNAKLSGRIRDIAIQPDGKILLGGVFTNYGGTSGRNRLVRLNSDGTLDTAFCINSSDGSKFNNDIISLAIQSDGKILVGGNFTNHAGTSGRNRLVRLNSDGTLDTSFCNNASDSSKFNNLVYDVAEDSSGNVYVCGSFTNYAGTSGRSYFIRLGNNGALDSVFTSNTTDGLKISTTVTSIDFDSNDSIFIGGFFQNYDGTSGRSRLLRFNNSGLLDTAFCENIVDSAFSGEVNTIYVDSDDKIFVGGAFNYTSNGILESKYMLKINEFVPPAIPEIQNAIMINDNDSLLINNETVITY